MCLLWFVVVVLVCLLHIELQIDHSISKEKKFGVRDVVLRLWLEWGLGQSPGQGQGLVVMVR